MTGEKLSSFFQSWRHVPRKRAKNRRKCLLVAVHCGCARQLQIFMQEQSHTPFTPRILLFQLRTDSSCPGSSWDHGNSEIVSENLPNTSCLRPSTPTHTRYLPPSCEWKSGQTGTLCLGRSGCGRARELEQLTLPSLEICLLIFQNPVQSLLVYGGFPSSLGQHYVLTSCSPGDQSQYSNHSARYGMLQYSVTSPPKFYRCITCPGTCHLDQLTTVDRVTILNFPAAHLVSNKSDRHSQFGFISKLK